jgi:GNAT superfamily N-acetyltransferase
MRIQVVAYDDPDAVALIEEVQQEYVHRYGGRDDTPVDAAEFAPPGGLFLVGYLADAGVACGGWRSHGTDAELKRMYVRSDARRAGLARQLLAELERTAAAAGHQRMILETGSKQPEAVALYRAAGYRTVSPFGHYANAPQAIHLAKPLPQPASANVPPPARFGEAG